MTVIVVQALAPMAVQAAATVDLDQWASSDKAWQNGNLNGNNSRYPEGGIVPFRLAIEGLKAGEHRIHIDYDVTAGGHKAYDFLATWNVTNAKGAICDKGGGARSSMCPNLPSSQVVRLPVRWHEAQWAVGQGGREVLRRPAAADHLGRHHPRHRGRAAQRLAERQQQG